MGIHSVLDEAAYSLLQWTEEKQYEDVVEKVRCVRCENTVMF